MLRELYEKEGRGSEDKWNLITGSASGIGLALAERFIGKNNEVIIVGRREEKIFYNLNKEM